MKFLLCGIGSIGQRHYKNLRRLGHAVDLFRSRRATTPFIEKFLRNEERLGRSPKIFYDLKKALDSGGFDGVFITNPSSLHIGIALRAAQRGCHLFIEKPVSHNLRGVTRLQKTVRRKKLKVMVGYNLRYHPLLRKMKRMVDEGVIGKVLAASATVGSSVEGWHPWEDYRTSYASTREGGGGVVLTLSHELDYLYWFFGKPERCLAIGGKRTPLKGNVDDLVKGLIEFPGGVCASVHLDYWQLPDQRIFEVVGTEGKLVWDYYNPRLTLVRRSPRFKSAAWRPRRGFDRNAMFIDEIKEFVGSIRSNRQPRIDLAQGIDVLRIALDVKRQLDKSS